jgi:hypothetical protein
MRIIANHASWCPNKWGAPCECDPEVRLEPKYPQPQPPVYVDEWGDEWDDPYR